MREEQVQSEEGVMEANTSDTEEILPSMFVQFFGQENIG